MSLLSTRRQMELMAALRAAAKERHREEGRVASTRAHGLEQASGRLAHRRREIDQTYQAERERIESEFEGRRAMLEASHEATRDRTQEEYRERRARADKLCDRAVKQATEEQKEAAWEIHTVYEVAKKKPPLKRDQARQTLSEARSGLAVIAGEAVGIARDRGERSAEFELTSPSDAPTPDRDTSDTACEAATNAARLAVDQARAAAQALYDQRLPRALGGLIPAGAFLALCAAVVPTLGAVLGWGDWRAYAAGVGSAAIGTIAIYLGLRPSARRRTSEGFAAARERLALADEALGIVRELIEGRCDRELLEAQQKRDADRAALEQRIKAKIDKAAADRKQEIDFITEHYPARLAEMRQEHDRANEEFRREHDAALAEVTQRRDERVAQLEADHKDQIELLEAQAEAGWQTMFHRWLTAFDDVRAELRDMRSECRRLFPDFAAIDYATGPSEDEKSGDWNPPAETPAAIAFGRSTIDLQEVPHGLSEDTRLHPPETRLELPMLMNLAEHPTLLLTSEGEGRRRTVELLRAIMLRFLTAMPPGKVRFTILDPIGLGDNFQAFMHLADADEQLIATRIWSQPRDIEEQLGRLTSHMETVLQKYLRSEFETIHEYNAQAGEVSEPFQVLVAAGFPAGFTEASANRLLSLVSGGPRCRVFTLLSVDTAQRQPTDFRLDDIKEHAAWLDYVAAEERFVWRRPALEQLAIEPAIEPPSDRVIATLRRAGAAAKAATRVEVPFDVVEPPREALWTSDCAYELTVPIGRAGANKLQNVRLGRGTSQHLLVAGKTGSGKSTFLHALVTSAAMHYAPDQVEFYLIDFKKGVEFKSYATHRLPHARVVAIESEREFGLSVLERLDDELRTRGERFRAAGVQNLADYRDKRPGEAVPRILLVIDEFQELFVEDDRLAQDATLLLDRLVRQGRAFGMHVVLGTQTLAGAFSIARSTLGQIAVRIALECSEADSHLILSDERNNAARFLSRPGEAIYNAQNGMLSANEPFQVVWLPDRQRSVKLDLLDEHRHAQEMPRPETIVFEGSAPADPLTNVALCEALDGQPTPRKPGRPAPAWIGSSVAIKPPAALELGRHPGANVLVVGSDEGSALGILSTAAVSLLAAEPAARVVVFDATRAGEEHDGAWARVADAAPGPMTLVNQAGVAASINELAEELGRREQAAEDPSQPQPPPIFVVLHNAGRFRELRKREDDFGFGMSSDEPKKPDALLGDLLRNGPAHGVHVLVWCDSFNSAQRLLDRQALREFALRVAQQMSAADSSHLIDSPAASDLKMHRALIYNDETGQTEKFRPYGAPSAEWLEHVRASAGVKAE